MTPEEIREHTADLMLAAARDVDHPAIRGHLHNAGFPGVDYATVLDVAKLIMTATIAVEFPADYLAAKAALAGTDPAPEETN